MNSIDAMMSVSQHAHHAQDVGQMTFFDAGKEPSPRLVLEDGAEVPARRLLAWEKELLGLYVSEHPLEQFAPGLDRHTSAMCGQIDRGLHGQTVIVAGMVSRVRRVTTRNEKLMAFAELEDLHGSVEIVVFPQAYEKTNGLWKPDSILLVRGKVQTRDDEAKVICESAVDYHSWIENGNGQEETIAPPTARHQLHISIPRSGDPDEDVRLLSQVHALLTSHPGDDTFDLYVERDERVVQLLFPNETTKYSPALAKAVAELVGEGCLEVEAVRGR